MKHSVLKRIASFALAVGMLTPLLSACSSSDTSEAAAIQATELTHGSSRTTSDIQIDSSSVSAQAGKWLLLSVENTGSSPVLIFSKEDTEHKVTVEAGTTGTLSKEIESTPQNHVFKIVSAEPGSEVAVSYTLTQSSAQPTL